MPATALQKLNPRQAKFAQAIALGKTTITQAAKEAGYSAKSAHVTGSRALSNAKVTKAVTVLREAELDKAGTLLRQFDRIIKKVTDSLSSLDAANLDPVQAVGIVKLLIDARKAEHDVQDRYGQQADSSQQHSLYKAKQRRFMQRCVALGRGVKLLGYSIPHHSTAQDST